jgi:hypothetical protein
MRKQVSTGAAWLSSVRSVRSALKWDNERNPCRMLQVSYETALHFVRRKGGQTSSQHGPYALGYTHVTMRRNKESSKPATASKSHKPPLSGDCSLQLDYMNADLVVIAGQLYRGEYVLASCTHRPSSQQSWLYSNLILGRRE